MAGLFSRIFRFGQSEAHSALDKFEDPIKMAEQGIRDLKKDLDNSMKSLAEVKALSIRSRRESEHQKQVAADYEKKAMLLLQRAETGQLDAADGDRLASEALAKKESASQQALALTKEQTQHNKMVGQLESNVAILKSKVSGWENELGTLKARAKVAKATKTVNKQLAQVDSSGTIAMLEKMRDKVATEEALAESYGEMAQTEKSVDAEIDKALASGSSEIGQSDALAALKAKMATK